jgi:hypothetical protein
MITVEAKAWLVDCRKAKELSYPHVEGAAAGPCASISRPRGRDYLTSPEGTVRKILNKEELNCTNWPVAIASAAHDDDLALMQRIDELFTAGPFLGSGRMTTMPRAEGHAVNRKRIRRLMRKMGVDVLGKRSNQENRSRGHNDGGPLHQIRAPFNCHCGIRARNSFVNHGKSCFVRVNSF